MGAKIPGFFPWFLKSHGIVRIPWLFCWVWEKIMGALVPDRTQRNRQIIMVYNCNLSFICCGPIITQIMADVWTLQDKINSIFVTLLVCVRTGMFLCTRREWTRQIYHSQNPWSKTTTTDVNNGSKLTFFCNGSSTGSEKSITRALSCSNTLKYCVYFVHDSTALLHLWLRLRLHPQPSQTIPLVRGHATVVAVPSDSALQREISNPWQRLRSA